MKTFYTILGIWTVALLVVLITMSAAPKAEAQRQYGPPWKRYDPVIITLEMAQQQYMTYEGARQWRKPYLWFSTKKNIIQFYPHLEQ